MVEGPLNTAFDLLDTEGVVSRMLTTIRKTDYGNIIEEVTRDYVEGDYHDHTTIKPIVFKKEEL